MSAQIQVDLVPVGGGTYYHLEIVYFTGTIDSAGNQIIYTVDGGNTHFIPDSAIGPLPISYPRNTDLAVSIQQVGDTAQTGFPVSQFGILPSIGDPIVV